MTKEITAEDIQKWSDDLVVKMADKGVILPETFVSIRSGAGVPSLMLGKKGRYETMSEVYFCAKGETLADKMADAAAHVEALPSPEQAQRAEFMRLVAQAADYGRKHNLPLEWVNPLTEQMQALSKNALEVK